MEENTNNYLNSERITSYRKKFSTTISLLLGGFSDSIKATNEIKSTFLFILAYFLCHRVPFYHQIKIVPDAVDNQLQKIQYPEVLLFSAIWALH